MKIIKGFFNLLFYAAIGLTLLIAAGGLMYSMSYLRNAAVIQAINNKHSGSGA